MTARHCVFFCLFALGLGQTAAALEPVSLINPQKQSGGWGFGNGPEFPGAKGSLELTGEEFQEQPILALAGDFTGGGNYVQAAISLPELAIDAISFWVNLPAGKNALPIRVIDGTGQCHQLRLKMNDKGGWQKIVLPVERYFSAIGTASALDLAWQYEHWSGANDSKWHQPGRLFVILLPKHLGEQSEVKFAGVELHPSPPKTEIQKTITLDEMLLAGEVDWTFNLGQEFKGAKGGLEAVADQPAEGNFALRLHADFSGGGAYVGMHKSFENLNVQAMPTIRMQMRSETTKQFAVRLVDETGQCHQRKSLPLTADGKWHEVEISPDKIAGGEHWGGANDGQWHGAIKKMELMLNVRSHDGKMPEVLISDIKADVVIEASATPASYVETFDSTKLPAGWETAGDVAVLDSHHKQHKNALRLFRTLDSLQTATTATSAPFAVNAGAWQVQYAAQCDLHSPDNSYHAAVALEVLDADGQKIETLPLGISYGKQDWQEASKSVNLPAGVALAKLHVQLNKTYGRFWIDSLSASRLSVQPVEQRIERILLSTDVTGNLFLPEEAVAFHVTVAATKPLPLGQQVLTASVRDYWGAEQLPDAQIALSRQEKKDGRFIYTGEIGWPQGSFQVGKFYQLHVATSAEYGEPVTEYSGFAVLPIAESKSHAPEEIPFTIRNWDSRVPQYFRLADRLGLRLFGVWGGWSAKPPYKPHLPGLEIVKELGGKWVTGTPASQIERNGFETYTEESLRAGMKNFLEAYADKGLAMIATGNEPHGKGQKVLDNVTAYKAIYETVKAFDPKIHVIGTSVEPNEEYFKAGYYNYLDSYDFHIYEHYTKVRNQMGEYRDLMKKYNAVKPIHSTELGLNSQGQTRLAAARELIKKCTVFFAEGGETVSWFTIQYPDPQGKARGQFGDAHCVFDCKFNNYNPKLDAITYYNMINGLSVKKFVAERQYADDAQAFLFRDQGNHCLQVLWADGQRKDVLVPLAADGTVELLNIDGTRASLTPAGGGVTVTLSDDPVMLLYDSSQAILPESLAPAALSLAAGSQSVAPGQSIQLQLRGAGLKPEEIEVAAPSGWKSELKPAGENQVQLTLTAPIATAAPEVRVYVKRKAGESVSAEIAIPLTLETAELAAR